MITKFLLSFPWYNNDVQLFAILSPIIFAFVVVVLGFVTPGYSHINFTISRLAIEKYGWIQIVNFLQFAAGLTTGGIVISRSMQKPQSRRVIRTVFSFSAAFLVLAAIAPTDPIDNVSFSFRLLTPIGSMHVGTVIMFLLIAPYGISHIVHALAREPRFRRFSSLTAVIGYSALLASVIWFILFMLGVGIEYRGITQKAIALLILLWVILMNIIALPRPFSTGRV